MATKGTLVIFAYECYPYNRMASAIGAQRPYQFAKNLVDLGWKVIVLCCDQGQRRTLSKENFDQHIRAIYDRKAADMDTSVCSIIPLPSLRYHGLADLIWTKTSRLSSGGSYQGKGFPYAIARKGATLYNQLFNGDYSWSWVPVAEKFFEYLLKDYKVDVVMGEHGPDAGIILADKISRKYNIPWIADFRDPALRPFTGMLKLLYAPVLKKIVRSASAVINVNAYWSALDTDLFKKQSYTIFNGYDRELFENTDPHPFSEFTVSYFGSFNEGFQDVIPSLRAFAAFLKKNNNPPDVKLFYRGLLDQHFIKIALDAGVPKHYLDVKGFCERKEAVAYMKGSRVLLVYSIPPYKARSIYESKGFYPGKIFEYIGTGNSILLFPTDQGLLEELIRQEKIGEAALTMDEAIVFFETVYRRWKEEKSTPGGSVTGLIRYSRQDQALQLEQILYKVLNKQQV